MALPNTRLAASATTPYTFPWIERPDLAASMTPQNIADHNLRTFGGMAITANNDIAINPVAALREFQIKKFQVKDTFKAPEYTMDKPTADVDVKSSAKGGAAKGMVNIAKSYIGQNRYQYGGFDCSKFVQDVARKYGVGLPRNTYGQMSWFKRKGRFSSSLNGIQPGDPIYFQSSASPSGRHVGIYIGGGRMIDNSGRGKPIKAKSIAGRRVVGYGSMRGLK